MSRPTYIVECPTCQKPAAFDPRDGCVVCSALTYVKNGTLHRVNEHKYQFFYRLEQLKVLISKHDKFELTYLYQ